jgi:hypothetical protein
MSNVARSRDGDIARHADPFDWRGIASRLAPPTQAEASVYDREVRSAMKAMTDDINRQLFTIPTHTLTEGDTPMANTLSSLAGLRSQQARLDARIAELEARYEQYGPDEFDVGAVLVWDKQFRNGGITYSYAAIKTVRGWYITGATAGGTALTWEQLVDTFLDDAATPPILYRVTEMEEHVPS